LLDNFKVKAVIDFNQRLFRIPLIATCVLLLEKEENAKERGPYLSMQIKRQKTTRLNTDAILTW
jgi:type I restriction-modification system DNA methylase subunit